MGTSSSYGGPTGENPLLPDWAPEPELEPETEPEQDDNQAEDDNDEVQNGDDLQSDPNETDWRRPKSNLSNHIRYRDSSDQKHIKNAFRNFVKANGGSKASTRSSYSGRKTAKNLGGFLSSVSRDYQQAFNELGIDFNGKNTHQILSELVDSICNGNNTREDSIARDAAVDVLSDLFEDENIEADDLAKFENLDDDKLNTIVENYVSTYVYKRFMQVLASRLENNEISSEDVLDIEWEIKDLIDSKTRGTFRKKDSTEINWRGDEGERVINTIFNDVYEIMEVWE
jgi:hypothetical protein